MYPDKLSGLDPAVELNTHLVQFFPGCEHTSAETMHILTFLH
jgi:hypothetical protein